ncbi:C45 family autoproteolytic acyltransferase/hydolase [Halanaerobium kushneri]|jgi:predicted choloylglycine hydrolase|uniref:Predicted choloylglycine hydrolase n=1 Tax=Halanaerobium kushneri TaxID=56779 RepID=A0A1N6YT46_9FIRM|nr:C45 family peptidase [Halanaerobium kushneri]SIR17794.1 Predicted choloylglycine hydrolase [Halanaerobium kushneri]
MESDLINRFSGTAEEIGILIGKSIGGKKFLNNISKMIEAVNNSYGINYKKLKNESMFWFENLPEDYQKELEGISRGANFPIEKIAQWYFSSMCTDNGCTSFITKTKDSCWIGRNNDYLLPESWGHINIIEVDNKIPVMLFGLEGDIFSGTGFNKEKLWIHYNHLPVWDIPLEYRKKLSPFVFIRKALESCKSVDEVERLLQNTVRDGGMNLFVVDGKNNQSSVFECSSQLYKKRRIESSYIAGANHYSEIKVPAGCNFDFKDSIKRQEKVENLLLKNKKGLSLQKMIDILSNSEVEQNNNLSGTVYSNIVCPADNLIYFAYDGFPAASKGNWQKIEWEW